MTGDDVLLRKSAEMGGQLLDAGAREAETLSWPSPSFPGQPNLTGFSHGAAGMGYALLELYRATGDHRFRDGAEGAFAYERRLYNPDAVNWPDLRQSAQTATSRKTPRRTPPCGATARPGSLCRGCGRANCWATASTATRH